jgi:hypothetical protein
LLFGIIAISVWFVMYQVRFKYPPMIRKIMDMRGAVNRAKDAAKIHPAKVMSREENIFNHFAKTINSYSFLQTRDSRYAAKAGGYAPAPDETTKLEWEITSIEAPEMPVVTAKGLKKVKGYTALEAVTAPGSAPARPVEMPIAPTTTVTKPVAPVAAPITPASPVTPGAPVVPSIPVSRAVPPAALQKPMVKPASISSLPKPSVAPLKALRPGAPGAPAAKPAPGAPAVQGMDTHENLYQQLVLLEQKRYKAERSMRDLDAKHAKGVINEGEYKNYLEKIVGGLDKIKTQIADIRRKLISF